MKKVLIFIGLKIAEIVGIVFVPYWVGRVALSFECIFNIFIKVDKISCYNFWTVGIMFICILVLLLCSLLLFIALNLELAKELSGEK